MDISTTVDNLMSADTTNSPASTETSDSDAVNCSTARVYFGPVQSPEKRLIASEVTRRRALNGAVDSPIRSSRLSAFHVPSSQEITDVPDEEDERSDEDADEISDVAAHLSREDTPENDALGQNEPSSVLASRIMRACDNPSPPPRAHPTIYFGLLTKDGRTPFPDISAPPSPFRPINLRERLSQFAETERALSPQPAQLQASNDQHSPLQDFAGNISQPDLISFESCSTLVKTLPAEPSAEGHPRGSPIQTSSSIDDLLSQSPQHPSIIPTPRVDGVEQSSSSDSLDDLPQGRVPADAESRPPPPSSPSPLVATCATPDILKERARSSVRRSARLSGTPRPNQITHAQQLSETPKLKGKSRAIMLAPEGEKPIAPDEQMVVRGNADPYPDIQRSTEDKERRRSRKRGLNGKTDTPNLQRELGSLSPQSADVLTRLLPSQRSTPLPEGQSSQPQRELSFGSLDPPLLTPQRPKLNSQHPNFSLATVQRPLVVAPTPVRPNGGLPGSSSHLKFSLTVDDASRTPARRVPIQDVFVQGSASSQNVMLLSAKRDTSTRLMGTRGPVFSRPALDDPSRSPAKRILITDLNSPMRSPTRPAAGRARSTSTEPKPIVPQPLRSRSVDPSPRAPDSKGKEPMFPKLSSKPRSGAKLPFPLVPGQKAGTDLPHSIPEEAEGSEVGEHSIANHAESSSSPVKSSLKKPSTGSRIPRIGAKPYARPQPKKPISSTTLPAFGAGPHAPPVVLVATGDASGNSDEPRTIVPPPNRKLEVKPVAEPSVLSTLKRKRGAEETVISLPTHPVMVRQVVPGMLGTKYAPKAVPELPTMAPLLPEPSPKKPPGPVKFRKVEPGVISARYATPAAKPAASDTLPVDDSNSGPQLPVLSEVPSTRSPSPPIATSSPALPESETVKSSHDDIEPQEIADTSSSRRPQENRGQGRRTSRRKAAAQHANDVFAPSTSTQPLQLRRSRRSEGDGFMGMTAIALQALTTSNTTKNQQIFAKLEREVIRKDGTRPESPTVKVRTILQKEREMKDQQRHERAKRRARRSDEGLGLSDGEGASELSDQSMIELDREHDENDGVVWTRHRRGPGEVEDYETPDRPVKRLQFGDGSQEEERERKRVKWQHGLSTEIYLDEIHPRPNSWTKDFVIEKSCLAPTSKNLRLDTLGNLVDVEQHPLIDLHPENIVVKKYVYDNDIEIEVVKEVIPPKITRSKSKKMKS
ncbi:uncharacterized protein EDB91DRAFT_1076736 [Suillus paluster]|uniref:uncharacterized protein n=1 Tax=Suillus paluster TaxID=48578 RepID=UPI001B879597|nr:uncharacterized protein EDB91DRAFT_1076736 [Suillus paluster]KAG1756805.1 hypothetical protein EDB91DRAFT_1076736 [Suillus paluster]